MSLTRTGKAKRADARGDHLRAAELRRRQAFVDARPVGEGCENCPEHCTAALCGDKCADKCYKKPDTKIYPRDSDSDDSSVNTGQPKYGGRKTRKKRRRKRRKTHKKRRKTKRKKRRRKKKKSRRRRK